MSQLGHLIQSQIDLHREAIEKISEHKEKVRKEYFTELLSELPNIEDLQAGEHYLNLPDNRSIYFKRANGESYRKVGPYEPEISFYSNKVCTLDHIREMETNLKLCRLVVGNKKNISDTLLAIDAFFSEEVDSHYSSRHTLEKRLVEEKERIEDAKVTDLLKEATTKGLTLDPPLTYYRKDDRYPLQVKAYKVSEVSTSGKTCRVDYTVNNGGTFSETKSRMSSVKDFLKVVAKSK
jgi:hypothetical protein